MKSEQVGRLQATVPSSADRYVLLREGRTHHTWHESLLVLQSYWVLAWHCAVCVGAGRLWRDMPQGCQEELRL